MIEELVEILKKDPSIARRVELSVLLEVIQYANQKYYNEDYSIFTDGVYDQIRDIYMERSGLTYMPAPLPTSGKMVKLPYYLGAMDKIKEGETRILERWLDKYRGPYLLSAKLDGVSALYIKNENGTHQLYSRGSHDIGQDISYLIKPLGLPPLGQLHAVRGEIIMQKSIFREKQFLKQDGTPYKNVRATVSGLINSKEDSYNREIAQACCFVAYELIEKGVEQPKPSQGLEKIKTLSKLKVVDYQVVGTLNGEILSEAFDYYLVNYQYDIDGVVFYNDQPYRRNVSGNPDYARAFKKNLDLLIGETVVNDVTWQCSRTKYLKPVLELEPVEINDVVIKRVTAHNAKYVVDNSIGIGSRLKIIRSGGVIPKILEVLSKAKPVMPSQPYTWNSTGVDLVLDQAEESPSALAGTKSANIKRIYYFLVNIGVTAMGEKTVEKIYDSLEKETGPASAPDIVDFLKLSTSKLAFLGPKTSVAIVESIKTSSKSATIIDLMVASQLFGRGIGGKKIETIMGKIPHFWKKYGNKDSLNIKQMETDLLSVEGIADKTASVIIQGYLPFINFFEQIKPYLSAKTIRNGPQSQTDVLIQTDDDFQIQIQTPDKDKSKSKEAFPPMPSNIVLSEIRGKAELERAIKERGGSTSSSVTNSTSILVIGDQSVQTTKRKSAEEKIKQGRPIQIMTLEQFVKLYKL